MLSEIVNIVYGVVIVVYAFLGSVDIYLLAKYARKGPVH